MNVKTKWGMLAVMVGMSTTPMFAPLLAHADTTTTTTQTTAPTTNTSITSTGSSDAQAVQQVQSAATTNVMGTGSTSTTPTTMPSTSSIDGSKYIPNTTISDADRWVSQKGDELVGLGGTLAQPVAILGFMIGLFITLAGAFTRSQQLTKGLLVMAISIFVYCGCVFAPELVHYFSSWLAH